MASRVHPVFDVSCTLTMFPPLPLPVICALVSCTNHVSLISLALVYFSPPYRTGMNGSALPEQMWQQHRMAQRQWDMRSVSDEAARVRRFEALASAGASLSAVVAIRAMTTHMPWTSVRSVSLCERVRTCAETGMCLTTPQTTGTRRVQRSRREADARVECH